MMKVIFCLAILLAAVSALSAFDKHLQTPGQSMTMFVDYIQKFNKVYSNKQEFKQKFANFQTSLIRIAEKNADPNQQATFALNEFSDLSTEEFAKYYLMKKHEVDYDSGSEMEAYPSVTLPKDFDWRKQSPNPVTPVKNQGQCGSCWAFSTTEEIESQWILAGNSQQILSVSQIVDCDTQDDGCDGGNPPTAYAYVIKTGGLDTEAQYPYVAEDGPCKSKSPFAAHISGWRFVTQHNNETQMQYSLYADGPLSICVDAASWQDYSGGIITSNCGDSLDHCVQVTGFGESQGTPYWWVRNSWGTGWGQQGYLQVERNKNMCGISDEVTRAFISGSPTGTSTSTSYSSSRKRLGGGKGASM